MMISVDYSWGSLDLDMRVLETIVPGTCYFPVCALKLSYVCWKQEVGEICAYGQTVHIFCFSL